MLHDLTVSYQFVFGHWHKYGCAISKWLEKVYVMKVNTKPEADD